MHNEALRPNQSEIPYFQNITTEGEETNFLFQIHAKIFHG